MAFEALTAYFTAKNQKAPQKAADVSVAGAQRDAMQANLDNWPMIQALLTRGNQFNQQQNLQMLEQATPGWTDWRDQQTANAMAYGEGRMSKEQSQNLTRLASERGISTGRIGQAGQYSLLRDFGIDQYQAGQMSQNIMQGIVGMAKVNPMSPLSLMATTQDALNVAESNRSATQAWMNAEQASQNVRKNAFWAALGAGEVSFQQASGYGSGQGSGQGGGGGSGFGSMMSMFGGGGGAGSAGSAVGSMGGAGAGAGAASSMGGGMASSAAG